MGQNSFSWEYLQIASEGTIMENIYAHSDWEVNLLEISFRSEKGSPVHKK